MRTLCLITFLLLAGYLFSCSSVDRNKPLLEEAADYHRQATAIQKIVEPTIERIDSLKAIWAAQKIPAASVKTMTLDSLKTAFEQWEENLVEVPGMPHDHTHTHGKHEHHHHADATLKDLPADQMRDIQRELLNNIKAIQARLEQVMP